MSKIKVVALFGASGSGKDTVLSCINTESYYKIVSSTTRPIREHEEDGVSYNFKSTEDFAQGIVNMNCVEASFFNDWIYGTFIEDYKEGAINVGVYSPSAIEALLDDGRFEVRVVEVYASDKVRLQRSLQREETPDCEEICRRFLADKKDFECFDFDPDAYLFNNYDWGADWIVPEIHKLLDDLVWAD